MKAVIDVAKALLQGVGFLALLWVVLVLPFDLLFAFLRGVATVP